MTLEEANKIMELRERAMQDPEYRALMEDYKAAYQPFWELWNAMPEEQYGVVDDYLCAAVALEQHLMVLALRRYAE